MKRLSSVLVGLAICTVSLSVWAADWTDPITIEYLDNNDGNGGIGYKVYSASGNSINPAGCGASDYALMGGATAEQRQLLARTLLSAFLAGRKVRLYISSSVCATTVSPSRPTFGSVSLDKDH